MAENSPEIRVSDADRERVAEMLREHFAQGRLDDDELSSRLGSAYSARTRGDLAALTGDLPGRDLADLPAESTPPAAPAAGLKGVWGAWAGVSALCFAIWLAIAVTTGATYPWFLWVAGPWGALLLCGTVGLAVARRRRTGGTG